MRLGVIGGLGPMATAYFMELLVTMTEAACDQDHLEMLIYNAPSIPDRTEFILGKSTADPVPQMIRVGRSLKAQGADVIAIPCMTAHFFHTDLQEGIGLPVLHGIRSTAAALKESGICRAGVMATDGTVQSGLFQEELKRQGIEAVLPSASGQAALMQLIYADIKAGRPPRMELLEAVRAELSAQGAECVILGCTELSVMKRDYEIGGGYADAMEILARDAICACGKQVRAEYRHPVTRD